MARYETQPNEVWQDAEGALMVASGVPNYWWVFGVGLPIHGDTEKVTHPLTKVADVDGTIVAERLNYG